MGGDEPGVTGITQRELLMEMRDDIRALRSVVDDVARDQALSVERRASRTPGTQDDPSRLWQGRGRRPPDTQRPFAADALGSDRLAGMCRQLLGRGRGVKRRKIRDAGQGVLRYGPAPETSVVAGRRKSRAASQAATGSVTIHGAASVWVRP